MIKIFPAQELISLFNVPAGAKQQNSHKSQALIKKNLSFSLVSAFFIIILAAWTLNVFNRWVDHQAIAAVMPIAQEERVAFQPGTMVSDQVAQGYLK